MLSPKKPKKKFKYKVQEAVDDFKQSLKMRKGKKVGSTSGPRKAKKTDRVKTNEKRKARLRDVRSTGLRTGQQKRLAEASKYNKPKKDEKTLQRLEKKGNKYVKNGKTVEKGTEGAELKRSSASKRAKRTLDRIDTREQRKMKRREKKHYKRAEEDASGPTSRNANANMQCGPGGCKPKK